MRFYRLIVVVLLLLVVGCSTGSFFQRKVSLPYMNVVPKVEVSGRLLEVTGGRPVSGVFLFLDGTAISGWSDSEGHFTFERVPQGVFDLVIPSASGKPYMKRIDVRVDGNGPLEIYMPSGFSGISDCGLSVDRRTRLSREEKKAFEVFGDVVMGRPADCRLLNPWVLESRTQSTGGVRKITYTARAPLQIDNWILGYRVTLVVDRITLTSRRGYYTMDSDAYACFEEMEPVGEEERERWHRNRILAYSGSQGHFLGALAGHVLSDEGFMVSTRRDTDARLVTSGLSGRWKMTEEYVPRHDPYFILFESDSGLEREIYLDDFIQVTFLKARPGDRAKYFSGILPDSQVSLLSFPDGAVRFNVQGLQTDFKRLMKTGYWGVEQVVDMLPTEYMPG